MQAAHIRNLLDVGVASGKYDMKTARCTPLDSLMSMYDFPLANARGGFLSHAAAQLELATASALRSLTTLCRRALDRKPVRALDLKEVN